MIVNAGNDVPPRVRKRVSVIVSMSASARSVPSVSLSCAVRGNAESSLTSISTIAVAAFGVKNRTSHGLYRHIFERRFRDRDVF